MLYIWNLLIVALFLFECRLVFCSWVVFIFLFAQAVRVMVDYWLSIWVDRGYRLSTKIYVIAYAVFSAGAIVLSLSRALLFTEAAMLSAKQMHGRMAEKVLRSPQLFFDQVYLSLHNYLHQGTCILFSLVQLVHFQIAFPITVDSTTLAYSLQCRSVQYLCTPV